MLTSKKIKQFAIDKSGFDLIGIANIEMFKDAPKDMHPLTIFPDAKSVIVCAKRIPRGALRGIEEGTYWNAYDLFGYSNLNMTNYSRIYLLSKFIEKEGFEAVPLGVGGTEW